jgi:hypothetical protein
MLIVFFVFALLVTLFLPAFISGAPLLFFAPFLILLYYKKPLIFCLWISLICGSILDLLEGQNRLGLHATSYCLATALLFQYKRNFFEDSLLTLPLITFFFAVISTGIQVAFLFVFERGILLTWEWIGSDLILMPILDAFYAFFFFTLPMIFMGLRKEIRD